MLSLKSALTDPKRACAILLYVQNLPNLIYGKISLIFKNNLSLHINRLEQDGLNKNEFPKVSVFYPWILKTYYLEHTV